MNKVYYFMIGIGSLGLELLKIVFWPILAIYYHGLKKSGIETPKTKKIHKSDKTHEFDTMEIVAAAIFFIPVLIAIGGTIADCTHECPQEMRKANE